MLIFHHDSFVFPHSSHGKKRSLPMLLHPECWLSFGPLWCFMFIKLKTFLKIYSFWISLRCKQVKDVTVLKELLKNNFQQCFHACRHWKICIKSRDKYFGADNPNLWLVKVCLFIYKQNSISVRSNLPGSSMHFLFLHGHRIYMDHHSVNLLGVPQHTIPAISNFEQFSSHNLRPTMSYFINKTIT
jgi:hypothetical protein